jgi:hypothetical protein
MPGLDEGKFHLVCSRSSRGAASFLSPSGLKFHERHIPRYAVTTRKSI